MVSKDGLSLAMTTSLYLVSNSFGLDHRGMTTLHFVLGSGTGSILIRSDFLQIDWRESVVTPAHLPRFEDGNRRPIHLLGFVILRLLLGNSTFRVIFIVAKSMVGSMIIGTEFLNRNVRAISCIEGIVETTSGTVRILA